MDELEARQAWYCPRCREDRAQESRLEETWKEDTRSVETVLTVVCPTCGWTATYRL